MRGRKPSGTFTVALPRLHNAAWPDRCIECGSRGAGALCDLEATDQTNGLVAEVLDAKDEPYVVYPPLCEQCDRRSRSRKIRTYAFLGAAALAAVASAPAAQSSGVLLAIALLLTLGLIGLALYNLIARRASRQVSLVLQDNDAVYLFSNPELAEEFEAANSGAL